MKAMNGKRRRLRRNVMAVVAGCLAILAAAPPAYCEDQLKCGQEIRIKSRDGSVYQGILRGSDSDSLTLRNGKSAQHTIALSEVADAYRVKRSTGKGVLTGGLVGGLLGLVAAAAANSGQGNSLNGLDERIATGVALTAGGVLFGAVIGGKSGHSSQKLARIQLSALPTCASEGGSTIPVKLRLAVNF